MMPDASQPPAEHPSFNDLQGRPSLRKQHSDEVSDDQPRVKRVACVLCRKRKLKCDGAKPSCATCSRLSHECSYDEVRKKSGPRKGYVRSLESRLAQVEELLKGSDASEKSRAAFDSRQLRAATNDNADGIRARVNVGADWAGLSDPNPITSLPQTTEPLYTDPRPPNLTGSSPDIDYASSLMGLGLEEPLPEQHVQDDLDRLYFQRVHPVSPMIHPGRYWSSLKLGTQARPPICLRYAMWAAAASVTDQYQALQEHFYQRARKYLQIDEMKSHGESIVSVHHVQAWYLVSTIEFKMTYFPRAWLSTGRASRLALMMGLHRLDGSAVDVKQCLPPPRDWTDREERRRTFWLVFTGDRFASIGTGWPMSIDEADIHTDLPGPEDAFESSREVATVSFQKAFQPNGAAGISSLGGVCLMASMCGRNLIHLHRGTPEDNEANLNGKFWLRHRNLDNTLLNIALSMPDHLRLPNGIKDQNVIFMNLCIHTATICLHQAAIFKADTHKLSASVAAESKIRCITSAAEVASIMRMISHTDLSCSNPFSTFCLYVAARVFVQYLKSRPTDNNVKASLHFLLTAMQAMRRKNLLTESLLIQLDIDLQGANLEDLRSLRNRLSKMSQMCREGVGMPVFPAKNDTTEASDSPRLRQRHTFGDNAMTENFDPNNTRPSYPASQASFGRVNSVSDSSPAETPGAELDDLSRVRFMPHRMKTPSARPSPAAVSDDYMDLTFDTTDSTSSTSGAPLSSRTSHTAQTPPMRLHDNMGPPGASYKDAGAIDINGMTNEQFQAMMNDLSAENLFSASDMESMDVVLTEDRADQSSTLPNMSLSPSALGLGSGGTGYTPLPSGDMTGLTSDELDQFINEAAVDMGWEGGFPASRHEVKESWKPHPSIANRIR